MSLKVYEFGFKTVFVNFRSTKIKKHFASEL
jgi:hypothetical protein